MARPKKFKDPVTCSFKLEKNDLMSLKDFASTCGQDVSDVLLEFVKGLVATNKKRIEHFRRQKNSGVKATFAATSKPARTSKTKAATIEPSTVTEKAGDDVAQDA